MAPMLPPRSGWSLPRATAALYRARRVLNEQAHRPPWGSPTFNDHLPWAFDCILDVRRTLHTETGEMRSRDAGFGSWWEGVLSDPEFRRLNDVRNEEVKGWSRLTTEHVVMGNVHSTGGGLVATDEYGRDDKYDFMNVESLPVGARIRHEFTVPGWEEEPVLPTLKRLLDRFEFEVIPGAMAYTVRWKPDGASLTPYGPSERKEHGAFHPDGWCVVLESERPGTLRWEYRIIETV